MEHPFKSFIFCPKCGARSFLAHDQRSNCCHCCGFIYYQNASAATAAVILDNEQRLLVCRRAYDPEKGTLDLPGGFVEIGETLEHGVKREVSEETHVAVAVKRFLFSIPNTYQYSDFTVNTIDAFFLCQLHSPAHCLTPSDDADALFWIPIDELKPSRFGLSSIRKGIEKIIKLHKEGLLV